MQINLAGKEGGIPTSRRRAAGAACPAASPPRPECADDASRTTVGAEGNTNDTWKPTSEASRSRSAAMPQSSLRSSTSKNKGGGDASDGGLALLNAAAAQSTAQQVADGVGNPPSSSSSSTSAIAKAMRDEVARRSPTTGNANATMLHLLITKSDFAKKPHVLRKLLKRNPDFAAAEDAEGLMPLHVACRHCPKRLDVIRILVSANPSALHVPIKSRRPDVGSNRVDDAGVGARPLHRRGSPPATATSSVRETENRRKRRRRSSTTSPTNARPPSEVASVPSTLPMDPQTSPRHYYHVDHREIHRPRYDGSYPLHIAIANGAPRDVVEFLVDAAAASPPPPSLPTADASLRSVSTMIPRAETVVLRGDKRGNTALSVALRHRAPLDVVRFLLRRNPAATQRCDRRLNTPLHVACRWGVADLEVLALLVKAYPAALHFTNFDGFTPLELAQRSECVGGVGDRVGTASLAESDRMEDMDDVVTFMQAATFQPMEEQIGELF